MTLNIFNLACLLAAAWAYATRTLSISIGDVMMLTCFFARLTGIMMGLLNIAPQVTRGFESLHSIGEVLESPDVKLNEGKLRLNSLRSEFNPEEVGFSSPGKVESALCGLSFSVWPGEVIAPVGPSGSGKSTLLSPVTGFVRPASGCILLDGHDMARLGLDCSAGLGDVRRNHVLERHLRAVGRSGGVGERLR